MAPLAPLVPPPMSIRTLMIAKAMPTPPTAYTNSCVMLLRPVGESVVVVVAVVASVVVVVVAVVVGAGVVTKLSQP